MHICKFKDGKYAIRRLTINGWEYLDLKAGYWWRRKSRWFVTFCKTNDLQKVKVLMMELTDAGVKI
jgi:hypothetical protein